MPILTRSTSDILSMATQDALNSLEEKLKRAEKREARLQRMSLRAQMELQTSIGRLQNEAGGRIQDFRARADDAGKQKAHLRDRIRKIKAESRRRQLEKMLGQERELRKKIEQLKEESGGERESDDGEFGRGRGRNGVQEQAGSGLDGSESMSPNQSSAASAARRRRSVAPPFTARPPSPPPTPPPPPPRQLSPSPPPPPLTPVEDTIWEKMSTPYTVCGECRKRGGSCYRSIELDDGSGISSSPQLANSTTPTRRSRTLTKCLDCRTHSRLCFTIEIPLSPPMPRPVARPMDRPGPLSKTAQQPQPRRTAPTHQDPGTTTSLNARRAPSKRRLIQDRDSTVGNGGPGPSPTRTRGRSPERTVAGQAHCNGGAAARREQDPPVSMAEAAKRRRLALIQAALDSREGEGENRMRRAGVRQDESERDVEMDVGRGSHGNGNAQSVSAEDPPPPPPPPYQDPAPRPSPCPMNIVPTSSETAEWQETLRNARSVAHAAVSMERRLLDLSLKYFGEGSGSRSNGASSSG